jgi:hypothetical protein
VGEELGSKEVTRKEVGTRKQGSWVDMQLQKKGYLFSYL